MITPVIISTYPPRPCGIGTYSTALVRALTAVATQESTEIGVIALSDKRYHYPPEVIVSLPQQNKSRYQSVATWINTSPFQVVNIQHEYGIFGGEFGGYLLDLMKNLQKPVVTTFHTVLRDHSDRRHKITQQIIDSSAAMTVMTERAKAILGETFRIAENKIRVIHHGIPDVSLDLRPAARNRLNVNQQFVLTTFGLLNPGKGIEYVLDALPKVRTKVPTVHYYIAGQTHPIVKQQMGEGYRHFLERKVSELGLKEYVTFVNKYLSYRELVDILLATDIYLSPQLDPHQASSGTLAYALGMGTAVMATPTVYAQEILAEGRGQLIPFADSNALAQCLLTLIGSPKLIDQFRQKSYAFGRQMIWPNVGREYWSLFEEVG